MAAETDDWEPECVCVCAFFHYSREASVFFSAKWASYDFWLPFHHGSLCEGHFILRTRVSLGIQVLSLFALKCLFKRANPQARPFLTVGGVDTRHRKGSRDTCFVSNSPPAPTFTQGVWPRSWRGHSMGGCSHPPSRWAECSGGWGHFRRRNQSVQSHRGPGVTCGGAVKPGCQA